MPYNSVNLLENIFPVSNIFPETVSGSIVINQRRVYILLTGNATVVRFRISVGEIGQLRAQFHFDKNPLCLPWIQCRAAPIFPYLTPDVAVGDWPMPLLPSSEWKSLYQFLGEDKNEIFTFVTSNITFITESF